MTEAYTYHKRDVSWLAFNHRVLQEAMDKSVPLYDRIKFLAIYSSNLDEFFRVRVSALRQFRDLKKQVRKELLDINPKKELKEIKRIVHRQQIEFGSIFREQILPELRQAGIFLLNEHQLRSRGLEAVAADYFASTVRPLLTTSYLQEAQTEAPFLKNRALYFIVVFQEKEALGLVNIPSDTLPRFVELPSQDEGRFIAFLDDLIRLHLGELFPEKVAEAYAIKTSRDAELYISDEYSGDLLAKIQASLDQREAGAPTRFLYDSNMPLGLTNRLKTLFHLRKNDLFPGGRYHNYHDFFAFPELTDDPQLTEPDLPPLPHPLLRLDGNLLAQIAGRDILLHFPYQQYDYVPHLIRQAADDPQVEYLKITLYRVAPHSSVIKALLDAREKGKKVTVFIEAKARFDEAANLHWGKELEKAQAQVFYSYPGIKVHTKLLLIGRREERGIRHYAYLGTGNFNEKTARFYGDHALLTAKPGLADEVEQVFALLERRILLPQCQHLMVSPFNTRQRFEKLVDREIQNAGEGLPAYMILKMNSLEDQGMIDKLYEASNAGVRIRLIVRGICCLVAGVPGQSEHIEVVSIVDRFLEHARCYLFANGGDELMYIASADWMTRNLDRRIEVVVPIYTPDLKQELRDIIDLQLADNSKARIIDASLSNPYRQPTPGAPAVRAQTAIYELLKEKASADLPE